ncbi:DUF6194 family protein [Pseudonocardia abyssalis]|jgi:hypothetical protein|uniref:DUF6194 domain-containing protein n=1 Tax=Pseudonocardia abyssalis TaxID=2792008 RepID=A0ABS6UX66_9PSEU|nr:DUF6194 family protein [Pseudonocardia abyssalis]MBW0115412.1 hypothetical protein [Pseudonocardia abyssalis]MBW0136840.1 hypothetical protein [Pseudonocardia abyssalis]
MDFAAIRRHIVDTLPGTDVLEANGDLFFVHDPDRDLPDARKMPWATIVTSNAYDDGSDLDRPGVFRLNVGLTKDEFARRFPDDGQHDLTAPDVLLPHPTYGGRHWACVLNPDTTWPDVRGLLDRAHARAVRRHANAARRKASQHATERVAWPEGGRVNTGDVNDAPEPGIISTDPTTSG